MGKSGLADLTEGYDERIKALGRVRVSSRKRARRRRSQPHARGASMRERKRERGIDSPDALGSWRLLAAKDAELADDGGECLAEGRHWRGCGKGDGGSSEE